jgi:hypothetical protein
MSVDNFIPEIWSARLQRGLDRRHVFAQPGVVNRDYEGEIRQKGDTVRITSIGPVSVGTYTKNTNMSAAETLTDAQTTLTIDQAPYFHFQVDDIDQRQAQSGPMDEAMRKSAIALVNNADAYLAGLYASAANAIGSSGSPKTDLATEGQAYEYLLQMGTKLDEADVPDEGRWCVVPPWYHGYLLRDDRFVGVGSAASDAALRNRGVGDAAGFTILKSNNVSNDATTWRILAGVPDAWSYAEQIASVEAYRPELRFGDAVKGLLLYGAKVVLPSALCVTYANKP